MIFFDTSTAIQILNGNPSIEEFYEKFDTSQFGITAPSIFKLYNGLYKLKYLKKKISKQQYKKINKDLEILVNQLTIYSLDKKAADIGAKIHMQLKGKGEEIDIFDYLIVAIIITNGFKEIITLNRTHFEKIIGLVVYSF